MDEYKPVTGELRRRGYLTEANIEVDGAVTFAKVYFGTKDFRDLCDDIDSVHAQLERENKSLREKVRRQGVQLTEVQDALERRNNGELKRHWQKELNRLKAERDSMAAALDAAQGEHAYAPESHYMLLPKDADGKPIHIGDEVYHRTFPHGKPCKVCGIGLDSFFYNDGAGFHWFFHAHEVSHQQLDSWERIVQDAIDGLCDEDELVARCKRLAGQS